MLEVMADDTFEQLSIPAAMLGDSAAFLKEGSSLLLLFAEDRVVSGAPPAGSHCFWLAFLCLLISGHAAHA